MLISNIYNTSNSSNRMFRITLTRVKCSSRCTVHAIEVGGLDTYSNR